jgi:hypothetical protein
MSSSNNQTSNSENTTQNSNNNVNINSPQTNSEEKTQPLDIDVQPDIDKNSFCSISTLKATNTLKAPFPTLLKYEQVINIFKKDFMSEYLVKDKEGLYCTNKDVVAKQSGLIKDIISQMSKGILLGGLMSLSLPIRLFEPRSMLERITDWFAFAPILLKRAGNLKDKIEAFKYAICFSLSALFRSTQQLKPFNPMLGETYQAHWEDGSQIYLEHTCHTPPVSHFYVKDAHGDYIYSGYFDMAMGGIMKAMFTNSMQTIPKGKLTIYLPLNKQRIIYQFPKITLGGILFGQRYVLFDGHMKFEDRDNNLKCVIAFNKSRKELKGKRIHDIYGRIFEYDYKAHYDEEDPFYEDSMSSHPFPLHNKNIVSEITGSWLEEILFDGKSYWNIKDSVSPQIYPDEKPLKSDSRFREDKIWLKKSWENKEYEKLYESYAQSWKLSLEAQQRFERGLRKKYS